MSRYTATFTKSSIRIIEYEQPHSQGLMNVSQNSKVFSIFKLNFKFCLLKGGFMPIYKCCVLNKDNYIISM